MGWWRRLREGNHLRPDTTAPAAAPMTLNVSGELQNWLQAAFHGPGSADSEVAALARMRRDPVRSAEELRNLYDQAGEQNFALRWALVHAAGQLGEPVTIGFFEQVLRAPIPPERSNDIHHFSSVAEETSLRCRAVDGLASLAAKNDDNALQSLLQQLKHPSFTVRAMACLSLRELPGGPLNEADIRRHLAPEEIDRVLAVRRVSIQEATAPEEPRASRRIRRPPSGEFGVDATRPGRRPPRISQ
jgi:hypothetical protein